MREKFEKIALPAYTIKEEILNGVTHGIGAIIGVVICIISLIQIKKSVEISGLFVYGISVIILYTCSTVYHSLRRNLAKKVMRMVDHSMIFVLICGAIISMLMTFLYAYNPFLVIILSIVCGVSAITGVSMVFINQAKFEKVLLVMYFSIASISIGMFIPIHHYRPDYQTIISFVLAGGIVYSIGFIFYVLGGKSDKKYLHGIFHIFVLAGTLLHLAPIYLVAMA